MTEIEKLISIWHLIDKNTSMPLSHEKVCGELAAIYPERPGQASLNILRFSNLVEANCQGEYILTLRGINLRRTIPDQIQEEIKQEKRTGHEWDRFRKVLSYYIDCVHLQERTQNYLAATKINKEFFIPVFGSRWLGDLGNEIKQTLRIADEQRAAMQRLLTRKDDDEEIYIGYPVAAFQGKSKQETYYSPIGLIPVDICDSSRTTLDINIRIDEAEINQSFIEFEFPPEERNAIMNTILRLHAHDEFRGMIDLKQSLPHLEKDGVKFNPENLEFILPEIRSGEKRQLCNAAVLFVGQPLKYSKTLKRELKYIRDHVDDATLDETALAYIFREPVLKNIPPEKAFMPLPFIESNPEQMAAVSAALNQYSSKITGPPGTGKSQVAVNIIANLIFNNKTVLFTSKNHKAVEAIWGRSREVLSKDGLSLVNFCTQQDPNPWYRQDLDILTASAGSTEYEFSEDKIFQVNEAVDSWRHIESTYAPRSQVLTKYECLLREYLDCQSKMKYLLASEEEITISKKEFLQLKKHIKYLAEPPVFKIFQLWTWLKWKFYGKNKDQTARKFLLQNYRDFWDSVICIVELQEKFDKFSEIYTKFNVLKKSIVSCESEAKSTQNIEIGEKLLQKAFQKINAVLKDALTMCRCQKIKELDEDIQLKEHLKSIMTFMSSSTSPAFFQRLESEEAMAAEEGFKLFSKFYPGWAVSLLSLTKASPCIPGLFDTVIIDEASQCDPASVIPALFRAKSIVFVGDSNQFPPVIDMKPLRNDFLKTKNKMTEILDQRYDFLNTAAFDLSSISPILLKEHFRCAEEISDYFNDAFYANELHIRTDANKLKTPACMGYRHAVEWIDIKNSNAKEIDAVEQTLKTLIDNNYPGTIGVITPFKKYADDLKERLYPLTCKVQKKDDDSKILINTANGFQGGERDVILFVLGYNDELTKGKVWYAESPENRYIYNVAVSRARACLIIIGDKSRCANSTVSVLKKLSELPRPKKTRPLNQLFDSIWEKKLYDALIEAGIETQPQYPVMGRRLDLAIIRGDLKIDIEIDGVHYHTDNEGNRKLDDIYRDLQVGAVGWKVKRFWVYELRDNITACVKQIQDMLKS